METRNRGGGYQRGKHHLQTITRRKSSLPCRSPPPRSAEGDQPPISTLRMGRLTTPRGGAGAPDATRQHPSCIPVQYPRCVRFPGRFQDSAVKCSMRPRIYCSPTAALVHAELQQEGSRGHHSAIPPFASVSGGGAEIARSGRRDLVTQPLSPRRISSIW